MGLVVAACLAATGCSDDDDRDVCDERSPCPDGWSCVDERCYPGDRDGGICEPTAIAVQIEGPREVDMLFMIDNSASMTEEQASLAVQIPRMIQVLATGSLGDETFPRVQSLRVGVITSDMGTGPAGVCGSMFGDDGVLQTSGNTTNPSCMATYPAWLEFAAETDDPSLFATDVECVATALGTNGCGFEQQLDAILKAVTPSTSGVTFQAGTVGHGDGQNAAFVRDSSLLVIVALTDEDDCSAIDTGLFEADDPTYDPNLNLRCFNHPEAVQPITRYVEGLLQLREDARRLIYAPIVGIPVDLTPNPDVALSPQVDAILADSRMIEMPNPDDITKLQPSCDIPGRGRTYPPRRMIALAGKLAEEGAIGRVGSICQEDYSGVVDDILSATGDVLSGDSCITTAPARGSDGRLPCELIEFASDCASRPGRTGDGSDPGTGLPRCIVEQLPVSGASPSGTGWYFDDFSSAAVNECGGSGGQAAFTAGAEPVGRSFLRLECDPDC